MSDKPAYLTPTPSDEAVARFVDAVCSKARHSCNVKAVWCHPAMWEAIRLLRLPEGSYFWGADDNPMFGVPVKQDGSIHIEGWKFEECDAR